MVVPLPTWLCRSMRAWCSRAICLTMASPRPVPPVALLRLFVHAVEPLKHAGLAVLGDADAVILYLQPGAVGTGAAAQLHMAAGLVVADGIVAQVGGQLSQQILAALHGGGLGAVLQRHVGLAGVDRHVLGSLL